MERQQPSSAADTDSKRIEQKTKTIKVWLNKKVLEFVLVKRRQMLDIE
jgi:hypothetical protein